jgi:hypothetical protein
MWTSLGSYFIHSPASQKSKLKKEFQKRDIFPSSSVSWSVGPLRSILNLRVLSGNLNWVDVTKTIEILIIFFNNNCLWNFLLHLFLNWYLIWLLYELKHVFSKPQVWFLAPFFHTIMCGIACGALLYFIISVTQILYLDGTAGLFTGVSGWLVS